MPPREFAGRLVELPFQRVAPGDGVLRLELTLSEGTALDAAVPLSLEWAAGDLVVFAAGRRHRRLVSPALPLELPVVFRPGDETAELRLDVPLCGAGGLCRLEQLLVRIPLGVVAGEAAGVLAVRVMAGEDGAVG